MSNKDKDFDYNDFPISKKVDKSIEKITNVGFPSFNEGFNVDDFVESISKILTDEFGVLPNMLNNFKINEFSLPIYRARKVSSFINLNLFTEHSHPPLDKTGFGRCNFPQFPVFYGSNDPLTALMEVIREYRVGSNTKYCISKWELIDNNEDLIFQSFLNTKLPLENSFRSLQDDLKEKINQPFEGKLNIEQEEGLLKYLNFLDTSFIKDSQYSLSASLAHRSLYAKHSLATDILMYPSLRTDKKGVNFAVHPNFVANNFKIRRFYIVELKGFNSETGEFELTFHKYGKVIKHRVFWYNTDPKDKEFQSLLDEDYKHLINQS